MPKLMIGCQGQRRAGPMNRIIFQSTITIRRMVWFIDGLKKGVLVIPRELAWDRHLSRSCRTITHGPGA